MAGYETEEQREEYVKRLCGRLSEVITREAPPRALAEALNEDVKWDAIRPSANAVMKATSQFIDGKLAKEELDAAAAAHLAVWREQFRLNRVPPKEPSPDRSLATR